MTDAELKCYLFADQLQQPELEQVMLQHFGRSSTQRNHTTYRRDGSDAWLRVHYTNNHSIRGFTRSPGYPESDIQALRNRIRAELLDDQETKVAQVTCFAYNPVTACARECIRGIDFQIVPMPPGNPTAGFTHARHPFMLEVTYQSSSNPMIRYARVQRSVITVVRFLNLLLLSPIQTEPSVDHAWVLDHEESDGKVDMKSRYMQLGYAATGLSICMDQFSDPSGVSLMSRVPAHKYYSIQGIAAEPLSLPDIFDECLNVASQLSTSSYTKLFIALTFFAMWHGVWRESRSASYASLVAAIEALLPDNDRHSCKACGQPIYQISKRFRDFLTRYAPGPEQASERKALQNAFYELRSGLAHGKKVLQADLEPWKSFHDEAGRHEDSLQRGLQKLVRIAILNWLWSQTSCT
jgi:hypothetical protein